MSKYKMGFRIQVGRHEEMEIVDLVEDYGYTEEEAKEIIADSDKQFELYTEWRSENAEQEYWVEESGVGQESTMVTVKDVIEIRKVNKILDKLEFCKSHTNEAGIKSFLESLEQQYITKNSLTEKQLKALDNVYNAIKEYKEMIWDELCGSHLD